MKMAYILARLATSRSRLYHGAGTARACGDHEWASAATKDANAIQRRIDALVKVLPRETIAEAQEITTAPI